MRCAELLLTIGWLLPALAMGALAQDAPENLIPNGSFEVDEDEDGMADGWQFSGNDSVKVTWSRDEGAIHARYSQKLDCTAFEYTSPSSHVMLALYDAFALKEGQWYRLSFLVKGENIRGSAATVAISQTGPWSNLGCNKAFRVGRDWQTVETTFRATKTISENLRLQIWFGSTGTIWIDDVRMVESEPLKRRYLEELPDIGSKNLIPNSSFECGTSGWGSITQVPGWGGNLNSLLGEIDSSSAARHGSSMKITVDRETAPVYYFDYFEMARRPVLKPLLANRGWISVEPGAEYTISADLKADPPGTPCQIRIYQAFSGTPEHNLEAPGDWERISFTFKPARDQVFVAIGPDLTESDLPRATLWVDGIQLEKGASATEYQPRARLELGIEWDQPGHLFTSPDDARATLIAFNGADDGQSLKIHLNTIDFFGENVFAPTHEWIARPGEPLRKPLHLDVRKKGFFRLEVLSDAATVIPSHPERFAVIDECTDAEGLFGMNHAYPWAQLNRLSKRIGLTWFRDWSLKWLHVEPEPGEFDFTEPDHQIDRVLDLGINVLPLLPFPSSNWASSAPAEVEASPGYPAGRERAAYMPRDLDEFANYVRTTVRHYQDRLGVWEIMNEPIYTSYALPARKGYKVEDYVRLLEVAYKAVKQVDPDALVIGGIAGHPSGYTKEFIEAGGLNWIDAINIHAYPGLQAPEGYVDSLRKLNDRMREAGEPRPIWFTEGAYYADDDMPWAPYDSSWMNPLDSERLCAEYQVRFDAILLAHGTEKIIYHSGTPGGINNEGVSGIFFEWNGAPRKMSAAQAQLTSLLGPDTRTLGVLSEAPWVCAFHSRGKTVIVLWNDLTEKHAITPAAGARLLDICGNEVSGTVDLTGTPYYLILDGEVDVDELKGTLAQQVR